MKYLIAFIDWFFCTEDDVLRVDDFFPGINVTLILNSIPNAYHSQITNTLILACIERVNEKMSLAKFAINVMGFNSFSHYINSSTVDNGSSPIPLIKLYEQAVINRIKAGLTFTGEFNHLKMSSNNIDDLCASVAIDADLYISH